jgi:hypothetical protein
MLKEKIMTASTTNFDHVPCARNEVVTSSGVFNLFTPEAIFFRVWDKTEREVPFNESWSNGTGYFDAAVAGEHAPKLGNGTMVRSVTPSGRKILIIGSRLGNIVVFQRYTNRTDVIVTNIPDDLREQLIIDNHVATREQAIFLIGDGGYFRNLGTRLDELYKQMKKVS